MATLGTIQLDLLTESARGTLILARFGAAKWAKSGKNYQVSRGGMGSIEVDFMTASDAYRAFVLAEIKEREKCA